MSALASRPFKPNPLPGKLNSLQRDYIIAASSFMGGKPVPFCRMNAPYQGQHALNGLVKRGLLDEHDGGFLYLTENGWKVARAIYALRDDKHGQYRLREIEAHIGALAKTVQP